jgi:hypothetical protein
VEVWSVEDEVERVVYIRIVVLQARRRRGKMVLFDARIMTTMMGKLVAKIMMITRRMLEQRDWKPTKAGER